MYRLVVQPLYQRVFKLETLAGLHSTVAGNGCIRQVQLQKKDEVHKLTEGKGLIVVIQPNIRYLGDILDEMKVLIGKKPGKILK